MDLSKLRFILPFLGGFLAFSLGSFIYGCAFVSPVLLQLSYFLAHLVSVMA